MSAATCRGNVEKLYRSLSKQQLAAITQKQISTPKVLSGKCLALTKYDAGMMRYGNIFFLSLHTFLSTKESVGWDVFRAMRDIYNLLGTDKFLQFLDLARNHIYETDRTVLLSKVHTKFV